MSPDGKTALDMLNRAKHDGKAYDIVVMDWKMPVMNGVECLKQFPRRLSRSSPLVIMVTAYDREDLLAEARGANVTVNAVLSKPVTDNSMLKNLAKVTDHETAKISDKSKGPDKLSETARPLEGAHLLLVEDNEVNQEVAIGLLANEGIKASVACNGQEALNLLNSGQTFDGVLMDVQNDQVVKPIDPAHMFRTIGRWIKVPEQKVTKTPIRPRDDSNAVETLPELMGIDTE